MFTFGRAHEIKHAIHSRGTEEKAALLIAVINAVHDLIDGSSEQAAVENTVRIAFVEGKSGVWEATGSWLLKLCADYPAMQGLWWEFARHASATVRFRVACHVIDLDEPQRTEIYSILEADKSKRIRDQAIGKWDYLKNPGKYA